MNRNGPGVPEPVRGDEPDRIVETRKGVLYSSDASAARQTPAFTKRLSSFLRSRYVIIIVFVLLAGSIIFTQTATLQLTQRVGAVAGNETGTSRQITVFAPRGVITDRFGTPLAYNIETRVLYLANADLESDGLNDMLADLTGFLTDRGIAFDDSLSDYLAIGPVRFTADMADVIDWQKSVLGLKEPSSKTKVTYRDEFVKPDPDMLFRYLRDVKFKITENGSRTSAGPEAPEADDSLVFDVMRLRYRILTDEWAFRNGTPLRIAEGLDEATSQLIEEQNFRFMGLVAGTEYRRAYSAGVVDLSHVMGYVGAVDAEEYEALQSLGYSPDAVVGKAGLESSAERYLAGKDGVRPYNVWTAAGEEGTFFPENVGRSPVPGNSIRLTIDPDLQKRAMELLKDRVDNTISDAGAMVVLDVKNGDVLAMASYPTYDPRDFLLMASDESAAARVEQYLTDTVAKPMLNRAIMENYAPGSTFKPCLSTAGLETGTITPYTTIQCTGYIDIDDLRFRCLGTHGWLNLFEAIRVSCNSYFYKLGLMVGIENLDKWAKNYGLGEYTGIDLAGEIPGIRSNPENKRLTRIDEGDKIWNPADTAQSSIGQFDHAYTVLQLARYAGGLATGYLVTPHVIKEVTAYDGTVVFTGGGTLQPVGASAETLAAIRTGMVSICHTPGGAGYRFFKDFPYKVALKTGTAEFGTSSINTNGLLISYAPADDPQIAIAHVINKDSAGSMIIDMHYEMYKTYFLDKYESPSRVEEAPSVH
ncbi:MAG: hypothetical protein KBA30_08195 [Clostridia bacterium]|nr:hypothetical protein [Clostridia bacterium]